MSSHAHRAGIVRGELQRALETGGVHVDATDIRVHWTSAHAVEVVIIVSPEHREQAREICRAALDGVRVPGEDIRVTVWTSDQADEWPR